MGRLPPVFIFEGRNNWLVLMLSCLTLRRVRREGGQAESGQKQEALPQTGIADDVGAQPHDPVNFVLCVASRMARWDISSLARAEQEELCARSETRRSLAFDGSGARSSRDLDGRWCSVSQPSYMHHAMCKLPNEVASGNPKLQVSAQRRRLCRETRLSTAENLAATHQTGELSSKTVHEGRIKSYHYDLRAQQTATMAWMVL